MLSGLVLAPVPVAAIWFGSPWLALLTGTAAAIMAWEWARLCRAGRFGAEGALLAGVVVAAGAAAAFGRPGLAIAIALGGAATVFWTLRCGGDAAPRWTALGALWVAVPCILLLWLGQAETGRATLLWILAIVWATDIGAYAAGRSFGGPPLAPRVSPKKTWSGFLGGILCAGLAGWATAAGLGLHPGLPIVLTSAALAIVEQFGDLAESAAKRRFGVKDSGSLIPGHGGLLDRLDGLLAVVPAVALLTLIGGRSVLGWR